MSDSMLSPYRVLDLANENGSFCARLLGDLGADVIKIERHCGDSSRDIGPYYHDIKDHEKSLFWFSHNTSKRGITLDIDGAEDQQTFRDLVKGADFLIESFPPNYMASLGLDYPALSIINPRLIMASVTPFGQSGPYKDYKASDIVLLALGGLMALNGFPESAPLRCTVDQAYFWAGIHAAVGMMIAHSHREITGEGQYIDVSMQECILPPLLFPIPEWGVAKRITKRRGQKVLRYEAQSVYPCKDGYVAWHLLVGIIGRRTSFLVNWMDSEGMAGDLKGIKWEDMDMEFLVENQGLLQKWQEAFGQFFLKHTKKELYDGAEKWGAMLFPVNTIADLVEDEQLIARKYWSKVEHPELNSSLVYPGAPFVASETPWRISRRAPLIGEHNGEIRKELSEPRKSTVSRPSPHAKEKTDGGALSGIRIADFSWYGQAPVATKYLADHGATVIKVESMQRVDVTRTMLPYAEDKPGINRSTIFAMCNSSKYSMSLNLNGPKGIEIAKKLVASSDVVVENFLPGTMRKLGLGYEDLRKVKPDIIMASASIQGQRGPHARRPGGGLHVTSLAGFAALVGWPGQAPASWGVPYGDFIVPWYLVVALLGALDYRNRTGRGQYIDISQFESAVHFLEPAVLDYTVNGRLWSAKGNRSEYAAPHGAYRCLGDDSWCAIAVFTDEEWKELCKVIGKAELAEDPRFATLQSRLKNEGELDTIVGDWTSNRHAKEVMAVLQQAGVAAGVVANGKDLFEDLQLSHRHHLRMLEHPEMGVTAYEAPPFRLSKTPAEIRRAPLLGEHTEYVCSRILGIPDDEFVILLNEGVFR